MIGEHGDGRGSLNHREAIAVGGKTKLQVGFTQLWVPASHMLPRAAEEANAAHVHRGTIAQQHRALLAQPRAQRLGPLPTTRLLLW